MVLLALIFLLSLASSSSGASISSPLQSWMLASVPSGRHSSIPRSLPASSQFLPLLASWFAILVLLCISGSVGGDQAQETGRNLVVDSSKHESGTGKPAVPLADEQTRVPCEIVVSQPGFVGFPAPLQSSAAALRDHRHRYQDDLDATAAAAPGPASTSSSPKVGIFPPFLEWGDRPLFSPSALTVTVSNRCNSTLLKIFTPFSSSIQFYAAAFAPTPLDLRPGQEVSLDIVFWPRSLGQAQAVVLLQTSLGGFFVQVQGNGIASPFGLAPLGRRTVTRGQTLRFSISLHNKAGDQGGRVIRVKEARGWPADSSNRSLILTNPHNNDVGVTRCCSSDSSSCSCVGHHREQGSYLTLKPVAPWEISPGSVSDVLEVHFKAAESTGTWSGFIYLGLSLFSTLAAKEVDEEKLLIPFNVRVGSQGQVLEPVPEVINFGFLSSRREVKKQAVTLLNTGPDSLVIRLVSRGDAVDSPSRKNLIAVRYRKGLVVHPGTQAQVAVAWYQGIEETLSLVTDDADSPGLETLIIHTNGSSPQSKIIRVPFHAVVLHGSASMGDDGEVDERVLFAEAGVDIKLSQLEKLERRTLGQNDIESGTFPSGGVEVNDHQQLVAQSLFVQSGLILPTVQVGGSEAVWLHFKNPSDGPVSVKLLPSHEWEASGCQCSIGLSGDCKARDDRSPFVLQEGGLSDTVLRAYQEADLGPLLFRPTQRCTWTGLLAVKNNLTAIDWIPVRGTGSSAELKFLEDNVPVETLRLVGTTLRIVSTVTSGIDENLSSLSEKINSESCKQPVNGSFVARNTGDIPLRVHSVSLMSGGCSSQGFELGSCGGFLLAAGETTLIELSYRSNDFVSPQVRHNNLQLVTSIGTVNVPVMVVLPDHMLRLCANIPAYFKYRKLFVYVGFVGLLCTVLVLPAKVGSKKLSSSDCDSGSAMAGSLPLFRDFSPSSIIAEETTGPSNLSKIRVKVTEEVAEDGRHQTSDDGISKGELGAGSTSSDFLQATKQQHSIAMSPTSSPRKTQLERGGKRKRKKGPVSLVKHEASRSGASSPSSSPASPLSSQRPALFSSDDHHHHSAADSKLSRLDIEVGRRMTSAPSLSSSSSNTSAAHWVPKDEIRKKVVASELKPSKEKQRHHHASKASGNGEWVTVARKSVTDGGGDGGGNPKAGTSTHDDGVPANKKKTLVQSASFLNSSRLQSQISPSVRAPGSKIPKNSSSDTTSASELNDSSSSSCNTSSRFSSDDVIDQASCSSPTVDLVYDIWGDHLGEMTRQSNFGGEETQSLFSVPAFTLPSKQDHHLSAVESSPEFSMFSGNVVAAFNRVVMPDDEQQPQQDYSSSYFLLSPFDLSYSKRMQFSTADEMKL
ncbi:hypothetical protein SELMODRAFT_446691 [Selaginella moellendorffii]|uniref:Uncharacterized protein n=1 Tax=Selaginella moellendorffii TaxID=88036 RepID=D8STJ6_SELML|nr:uncharacterized protein LOC9660407 [Selaginella moellendorffii]EFJ12215.1 hypothetical protein SELMODRAFT_446691 [Selaginella moellendorffii]|eukprot:XP_002986652.1 uncharacterized protein LOC9660407 [Selaginella moellendorffii]